MHEMDPLVQKGVAAKKAAADQVTQVNCMMCHRGAAIPTLPPPPAPAGGPGAAPGAGRGNQ